MSKANFQQIKKELANNQSVYSCASKYGNAGDPTAMKVCYLIHHYSELSVSEIASLINLSVSATSRCLKKLQQSEVVASRKDGQSVYHRLEKNEFTTTLIKELEGANNG